ncbi:MAG: aldehyde dehydrogenase family protein [Bacilli bacterium]|nr:aldehyde dehydrogenase family protein [Bacilli bacterium]
MEWSKESVHALVTKQREYFLTGKTLSIAFRKAQLLKLKNMLIKYQSEIEQALHEDLGRCDTEAYLCDIGPVILELDETIRGLKKWARPERLLSGVACFPSATTKIYKMPYGVSLIVAPFNFPFLLSVGVLIPAIAGGNTAVIKCSSKSKASTACLQKIIAATFPEQYITVVDGGHDVADFCLNERFDKIFYTGSPRIGIHVMECAAKNLTPVTLELGGETGNWCIIRKDADLLDAAKKIAFFKICNSGQICININQIAVAEEVADKFIKVLKQAFISQIGEQAFKNPEYAKLITRGAYDYCAKEAEEYRDRIVFGGEGDPETCKYSPTIIYPVKIDEKIVNHELFSPLLPIVTYKDNEVDQLLNTIARREHGLALYLFTKDMSWARKTMSTQQYGGGCVNEVIMHMVVKGAPFGGTGHSGMGCYHGVWGFREFTHPSTVLFGKTKLNLPMRQHPYNKKKKDFLKRFIK